MASDPSTSTDLSDLIRQLEEFEPGTSEGRASGTIRIVLATDWSDAAPALTLIKAFRAIVPHDLPIQLAFAVPHAPAESDAANVQILAEGSGGDGSLRGLEVVSFEEAAKTPYDSAVVPTGDAAQLITQVGGAIVRMHDLVRRAEGRDLALDQTTNRGDLSVLRRRLDLYAN